MTIVRNQIHCLVMENGVIVIVTENDWDSLAFQFGCAQEWFAYAHHSKRHLYQHSSANVPRQVTINNVLSVVLQCHVACCHCLDV